ncbi:Na/Pi cotransporter family protein [Thermoanaerobacter pentosaceus]|uniref:Phosphate:Na+ symporter n=1 Tax=Thermoanaerobacter pentosaceus TaxID=694059 RepID=A0ABT9M6M1_9THEO|nr:Na/Pi symporter [Thermoanaerobacter pentosaceus]MDP9751717.1 phosphate:Na+ symporter [Thermoanaerobacter pentosaceus]
MVMSLIYFVAGIGVFIWGIFTLTKGLKAFSQQKISQIINKFASNLLKSIIIGFFITLIVQSSSMVAVIAITMAGAELLNLKSAAGIIIGSNIGTTIAVQLYAFNLFKIAPYLVFIGSLLHFQNYGDKLKIVGRVLLGFGLVLYGLKTMELATIPLKKNSNFDLINANFSNPLWGIVVGIITALILQSSNVGIATLQVLVSSQLITLSQALPIIYGLNIGTCSEAIILSFSTNKEGKKIALFNIFFNIVGTILFLPFTNFFTEFLKFVSPYNPSRQVANAHTFFNLFSAVLIVPFLKQLFALIDKLVNK